VTAVQRLSRAPRSISACYQHTLTAKGPQHLGLLPTHTNGEGPAASRPTTRRWAARGGTAARRWRCC
jgi:hypothetical protein